jgi:hypothetical protein
VTVPMRWPPRDGWTADRGAGRDSLLLAGSNTQVTELNARARAARLAGTPDTGQPEVRLRDGNRRVGW